MNTFLKVLLSVIMILHILISAIHASLAIEINENVWKHITEINAEIDELKEKVDKR